MAAGDKSTDLSIEKCQKIIHEVSEVTSHSQDAAVLLTNLLRLLPCLESHSLNASELSLLKTLIWERDLIHLVIEVLRNDYSSDPDGWRKLTNLAVTLVSTVSGLTPKETKKSSTNTFHVEQVKEYYDIILPTALDSILILANSILEALGTDQDSPNLNFLEFLKKILDSLLWLCCSHNRCIPRALQSPYLLSMLITDHELYSHIVLMVLESLILTDKQATASVPNGLLSSFLDELVYKLSGTDREGACLSLRLLGQFCIILPSLVSSLGDTYMGILSLAKRWVCEEQDFGVPEKYLITELESRVDGEGEMNSKQRAALFIQASWRGYASRKKMVMAQRGIRRFQKLFRSRRAEKLKRRDTKELAVKEESFKTSHLKSGQLAFHEKQLSLYEQLPASQLQDFIQSQERKASITIQSAWRGRQARGKCMKLKTKTKLDRSAVVIQRTFRRYSEVKRLERNWRERDSYLPKLPEQERHSLQREVALYRETRTPVTDRTPEQAAELHLQAQQEYEKFFFSRDSQARRDQELELLVSKLNRNCDLLLGAPSLDEAYKSAGVVETFSSSSSVIAKMARTAHREELKAMHTPWWKKPPLDHDQLDL